MARPPIALELEVSNLDGSGAETFPASREQLAGAARLGTFTTKLNTGFEHLGGTEMVRDPNKTYGSPRLLQSARVVGNGDVAWEGEVSSVPQSRADSLEADGYYVGLKDAASVAEVYADADMGHWGEMPAAEKARVVAALIDIASLNWSNENGNLFCSYPAQALPAECTAAAWYQAPPGCLIASVKYTGSESSPGPSGYLGPRMYFQPADSDGGVAAVTVTLDSTERTAVPANGVATRYVSVNVYSNGSATTPTAGMHRKYTSLKAIGDHGLTNIYASEVIKHAIGKYAPHITANAQTVDDTTYTIGQLVFDGATVVDVIERCNAFHLWEIAVWEGRKLYFKPARDRDDYDYMLSTYRGDHLDRAPVAVDDEEPCNGVWVYYTNVATGRAERIGPYGTTALHDSSGDTSLLTTNATNPCVREGRDRFPNLQIGFNTTQADAIVMGSLWLAERQIRTYAGTGSAGAYVRNRAGQWVPSWKIRAGDRVKYVDEDIVRRVYSTSYDHSTARNSLTFEKPPSTVAGIQERVSMSLQAANL